MKQLVYLLTGWLMCGMGLQARAQVEPLFTYKISRDEACNRWVESQMKQMNLREKIGQLFIYTIAPDRSKRNLALLKNVVHTHKVGGLLFSGGKLDNQALLTNQAQKMADVPLMITFDGEWGLSMRLRGTPVFPKNMVLGCIQDDRLIYEYGQEMARQCRELGVQVNFAPVADVNINPQNPVINVRSFGENPLLVADKVIAYASGLESGRVLSVAKHFPGHGDTDVDSHKALPVLPFTRERLDSVELYPFRKLIHAGLGGVMVGHLQVPVFEPVGKLPSSLSRNVVYTLLTEKMAFKGLIFTDALAMKGVSSAQKVCLQALKAGNDVVLAPRDVKKEIDYVVEAVKKGEFTEEEIDERCRKVLLFKYAMGLNRKPVVRLSGLERRINTPHTRDLIRRLNLAAVTVLNNEKGVLPIHPDVKKVAVLTVGKAKCGPAAGAR
jgi:beta-glucosidase-like glycosyl hydrolase